LKKIIERFQLQLSPADLKWFEGGWRYFDGSASEYHQALDPQEVLEHGKGIWGGMMLPDSIPLLENGMGDSLCARFSYDGTLSEIIEWHHEGAGWRHYGYSIDQAIALDLIVYRQSEGVHDSKDSSLLAAVSPVAMNEMDCNRALTTKLADACRQIGTRRLAELVGASHDEFSVWFGEPAKIPASKCEQLAAILRLEPNELIKRDWHTALSKSQSVLKLRSDLAWPYGVAGRAFEELGRIEAAAELYKAGVKKLGSSSSFTEPWSLVSKSGTGKFAADRLLTLAYADLEPAIKQYLDAIAGKKVRDFWFAGGNAAATEGDFRTAYDCYFAVGWDIHYYNDMAEILKAIKTSAGLAGSPTLEAIGELHFSSLI
jgi:tetratricopeptide (TPR) repeat protein